MNSSSHICSTVSAVLALAAALPATAADRDDSFWRQLQRTDGAAPEQTQPMPRPDASLNSTGSAPNNEWIVAELKKADGYAPEPTPSKPAPSAPKNKARVRDGAR